MDHTAHITGFFRFHDIQRVLGSVPAVDNHRKLHFPGQVQLAHEPYLLYGVLRLFPVIIQANLAHCPDLFVGTLEFHPLKSCLVKLCRPAGMDSQGSVHPVIMSGQQQGGPAAFQAGGHIHHRSDAAILKALQKRLPVLFKRLIIIMGMCVKNHISQAPLILCPVLYPDRPCRAIHSRHPQNLCLQHILSNPI